MRKSFQKRFRITKTGKIIRRQMAQDHFRAKRSGKQTRNKRKTLKLGDTNAKVLKSLSHN